MRNHLILAAIAASLAAPMAAHAGGPKGHTAAGACPPGLAKKSPACLPPGQAKKTHGKGTRIDDRYILIRSPDRYGLDPDYSYYRMGGQVFRVDRETREILNLIGAAAAVLN